MALALRLAAARLRRAPGRWAIVALGVALAASLPVLSAGTARVVSGQAVERAVSLLPVGQRSLVVSFNGFLDGADLSRTGQVVSEQMTRISDGPVARQMLFRRLADPQGRAYALGATDDLSGRVRVVSGRAPRSCTPQRCEVVLLGRAGSAGPDPSALGVSIVGTAVRVDPLLLSGTFDPGSDVSLLLSGDVPQLSRLTELEAFQRSYGWVAPLDLDLVRSVGVAGYLRRSAAAADQLFRERPGLVLTAPDSVLRDEAGRSAASAGRFRLLGGTGAVLLLGLAVVGATGVRRDAVALADLLRRRGARRRLTVTVMAAEALAPVAAGLVAGVGLGCAAVAVVAQRAGVPVRPAVAAGWSGPTLPTVAVLGAAAVVLVCTVALWRAADSRGAWRWVDAVLAGVTAALVLAASRGTVDAAGAIDDPLVVALPALAGVAAGLLAARLAGPAAALLARLVPATALVPRLALAGPARRPLRTVATVACLATALTSVVFAVAYRATLQRGAADQAAFVVPLDLRVTSGPTGEMPLDVAPASAFAAAAEGRAFPVVRAPARVRQSASESVAIALTGVDPAVLPALASWRGGDTSPQEAARRLGPATQVRGVPLPPGGSLHLPAGGGAAALAQRRDLAMTAWLRDADGRETPLGLQATATGFRARLPSDLRAAELWAVVLRESPDYATRHQHVIGEGSTDVAVLTGTLRLGRPEIDGRPVAGDVWPSWRTSASSVGSAGGELVVPYRLGGAPVVVGAGGAASPRALRVLVDPATAAAAGGRTLNLVLAGGRAVRAEVVGVLDAFPTVGPRFAVAAAADLATELDRDDPGSGETRELWLTAGRPPGPLADSAPYDRTAVRSRALEADRLANDPVALGAVRLLATSAGLALLVGALALVLLAAAERRDDAAELLAWETDGVSPRDLRRMLALRAVLVAGLAVPVGVAGGAALSRAAVRLVTITAEGTAARPPLLPANGTAVSLAAVAGGVLLAVAAAAMVAFTALREPSPRREQGDLG